MPDIVSICPRALQINRRIGFAVSRARALDREKNKKKEKKEKKRKYNKDVVAA